MSSPELSTIALLLYPDLKTLDFARIVAELDAVLRHMRGAEVEIAWDCDDVVTFDVPETRILLSWSETGKRGVEGCLTVAVGPNPLVQLPESHAAHDLLCSRLVEKIQGKFPPEGVLWRQMAGPIGADQVDEMIDRLPGMTPAALPAIDTILDDLSRADLQMADLKSNAPHPRSVRAPELSRLAMAPVGAAQGGVVIQMPILIPAAMQPNPGFAEAANDRPWLPLQKSAELARLRDALYPEPGEEPAKATSVYSTQMRLAAHCMNATLIVVYPPLGAAVMTYSLLRGEDMRLSSRMMAVAGTLFALAHSPVGQTMAAMAKGLV